MKCPYCEYPESKVIDSRVTEEDSTIRRRRQCLSSACNSRFTTYERVEDQAVYVIKKDRKRERFDRQKVLNGILRACEKRPISLEHIESIVSMIEREIKNGQEKEITSEKIGRRIMEHLRDMDHVAYVRFASVYKEFEDIKGFQKILESLNEKQTPQRENILSSA